jgi:hypothetical protein
MSWYHEYDGGRAWYTNMGHTDATFSEPQFLRHLAGGIKYALGIGPLDWRRARPEENRFTQVILGEKLDEPMELAVLPDERVLFIERRGAVKLYTPSNGRIAHIGSIPVSTKYNNGNQAEDGLLGLTIDPAFARNGWVYMYYSPEGLEPRNVLARFTMQGDSIDLTQGKVMLDVAGEPLALDGGQHEPVRDGVRADRRAPGARTVGRAEVVGQHERSAREDSAHPSGGGWNVHHPRWEPLSPGNAEDAPRDLYDGTSKPIPDLDRSARECRLLG